MATFGIFSLCASATDLTVAPSAWRDHSTEASRPAKSLSAAMVSGA